MTRVDFYVLDSAEAQTRLDVVCKLAEKAVRQNTEVIVYARDSHVLEQLDERLWSFSADSFIGHCRHEPADTHVSLPSDPVVLTTGDPGSRHSLLINMDEDVPTFFSRFERLLEIVNLEPAVRDAGRLRYRFYRERGYPMQHHKL